MQIPLNVVRAFPSNSQRAEAVDEFRCVKETIDGQDVLVERYATEITLLLSVSRS